LTASRQAAEIPDTPTASVCAAPALCVIRFVYTTCVLFEDEACLVAPDRIDRVTVEQRWLAIGAVRNEPGTAAVLLVVHVYREEHNGEEIIRIISARAAEKHEVRRYQKQTID
jgi:uncharacterized DUF497 family protein